MDDRDRDVAGKSASKLTEVFKRRRNGEQSDTHPLHIGLWAMSDPDYVTARREAFETPVPESKDQTAADYEGQPYEQQPDARASRGHLIYAQVAGRYVLVERNGEPPEPDALLELPEIDGETLLVGRVGRSPLPNDSRPCAFAQQVSQSHS